MKKIKETIDKSEPYRTHGIGKITAPRKPKEDPKATKTSTVTGDLRGGKD